MIVSVARFGIDQQFDGRRLVCPSVRSTSKLTVLPDPLFEPLREHHGSPIGLSVDALE